MIKNKNAKTNYIGIDAVHYTVFENESIDFTVKTSSGREPEIKWGNEIIPSEKTENGFRVVFNAPHTGEYRIMIKDGDVSTWADFIVKPPFGEILEKRCPNCGAPVHAGGICSLCGEQYVAV